jgi:SRSO17 transposase
MDVHASPDLLPELDAFLSTFKLRFRRPEVEAALERYLRGLLTELPNKNCDTMAQAVPGTHEQRLQGFLTTMQWDEEALNRQRVEKMIAAATIGNGVLIFDDTGFAKQGQASVGVARQYAGTLGKVGNCQVAVTCCSTATRRRAGLWPCACTCQRPGQPTRSG